MKSGGTLCAVLSKFHYQLVYYVPFCRIRYNLITWYTMRRIVKTILKDWYTLRRIVKQ